MTPLEETLGEALSDFGLRELPKEWHSTGDTTLVDGIALVVKATGKEYCKVANVNDKISVVRDYGRCSAILRIEKIFAVNTITKYDIPAFKNDEAIVTYLCKSKYDRPEVLSLLSTENKSPQEIERDRGEINRRIKDIALGYTKRKLSEKKRVEEIKEYAEKAKSQRKNGKKEKKCK